MTRLVCSREAVHAGNLVLVNRAHPIHRSVGTEDLAPVDAGHPHILLRPRAQAMLARLLHVVRARGTIVPVSGYRSEQEQARIYAESLRENGAEFTRQFVALPNASEHQTGLAIDLGEDRPEIDFLRPRFAPAACDGFQRRAAEHGFVRRYAAGKEAITGIACEPWHYRYVGRPHAAIMQRDGLALEEYTDYLKRFPERGQHLRVAAAGGVAEVYYAAFPDGAPELTLALPDGACYEVSGNNVDGLVVTLWGRAR
jgi:D-alanyl-D-alanine dipeptidase/carboxypeptidase